MLKKMVLTMAFLFIFSGLWSIPEVFIYNDDFPCLIGQYATFDQNSSVFQWEMFDSLRTWWNLTVHPGGMTARVHLLDPSQGLPPATDTFPNAEIVELDTLGTGDAVWSYLSDTTYFFYIQGIDMTQFSFRFIGNYMPDYQCYVFPIYDGFGWNTAWQWTYEVVPGLPYTATEQHQKLVVAKGKVKVPVSADHYWPCLVVMDYMTYSDTWGSYDTRWIYEWVVPGRFAGGNGVAAAMSTNGGPQNFILVDKFFKMNTLYVPGWDLRCPDFANTTIWPDTTYAGPYMVSTEITDSTGVGADSLFYIIDSGAFVGVGHDSVIGDIYYFTIPAVAQSCSIGYFLWAEDSFSVANNVDIWNTDPICAPESTYYIFAVTTGIEEVNDVMTVDAGFTCVPNPFNVQTEIAYDLRGDARSSDLCIRIYDISGRIVTSFADLGAPGGHGTVLWKGVDARGRSLPNGVYFVELETSTTRLVHHVVIAR
jgi:hypothetical protein